MPKQVDHDARREELAAALWRVVTRDGVEAASLRGVAAEAGWSAGSLRHYFPTQSELLAFAMDLVSRRVVARIAALEPDETADGAARLLHEVLPLDAERRTEMQVWLAFTARAFVDPTLHERRSVAHEHLRDLARVAAARAGAADPDTAADALHALIDGLALHALLAPERTTPARQVELVDRHLAELARRGR